MLFSFSLTRNGERLASLTRLILFWLRCFSPVSQIRWLLEDEIVSALRHSLIISSSTLQKVTQHILSSSGRPHCHCEDVPLQFVFGPEQSMEKFKEARTVTQQACFDSKKKKNVHLFISSWTH